MSKKEEFKVLTDVEHILLRPNMYVGSVTLEEKEHFVMGVHSKLMYTSGAIKCINEIIDNSIDQYIRSNGENANQIDITISGTTVTVSDNGSGIPSKQVPDLDGTMKYTAHLAWTKTKAGSNFNDDGRNTVGMNGVGSSLTNIFSKRFVGTSIDSIGKVVVECSNNCSTTDVSFTKKTAKMKTGVTVEFDLDLNRFGLVELDDTHIKVIEDRVASLSVIFPGIKFTLNGSPIKYTVKNYAKMYSEDTVLFESDDCSWFVFPSEDGSGRTNSYVNGVQTFNGGSHIDFIYEQLIAVIRPEINKRHDIDVTPNQIRSHLQLVLFMKNFSNPKFDSQTKERLTNSRAEVKQFFDGITSINWTNVAKKILANNSIIGPVVDALLAKKLLAEKRALAAEAKKNAKRTVDKHLPARDLSDKTKTQLFIVEGHSALGSLIDVRESYQGGYALKGKILNIDQLNALEIMKNDEIADIISILGLSFDHPATIENTEYAEINFFTDADQDGSHIISLLINFFSKYWPELFIDKRISIIKSPLVKCSKNKQDKYYYDLKSFITDRNSGILDGYSFSYKKGLGSLSGSEYRDTIMNRSNYFTVELNEGYKDTLNMAFGTSAEARRQYISKPVPETKTKGKK